VSDQLKINHPLRGVRQARLPRGGTDSRLVDVGFENGRISGLFEPGTIEAAHTIDAGGACLHPGFVDAHLHLSLGGQTLGQLDLAGISSREAFEAAIAARADDLEEGRWLEALGWNEANWPERDRPTVDWLKGAGDRPVVCYRMDYHACVVNEPVLAMLEGQPCPPGGEIVRDENGRPNGLMLESAAWHMVNPLVPEPTAEQARASAREAARHCARQGLVAVGSMEYAEELMTGIAPQRDELGIRILVTLLERTLPLDFSILDRLDPDEQLSIIGFKAFIDGTLGSRTAAMLEPYADVTDESTGMLVELAEAGRLEEWIRVVHEHGQSPSMHAIGDRALRLALDAADTLPAEARERVRFEHAQTIHPDDLPRMRGRFASMQPLHKASDAVTAGSRLGAERMHHFFPFRGLLEAGARLAFGSDWPIVACNPFAGIRAAVTARDLEGNVVEEGSSIPVEAAIEAYTTEARACLGLPGGRLEPGEPADLVLLDRDPAELDWNRDPDPKVLATIVAGRIVHEAS
jgi:predicted amidohydrolase YtcJ